MRLKIVFAGGYFSVSISNERLRRRCKCGYFCQNTRTWRNRDTNREKFSKARLAFFFTLAFHQFLWRKVCSLKIRCATLKCARIDALLCSRLCSILMLFENSRVSCCFSIFFCCSGSPSVLFFRSSPPAVCFSSPTEYDVDSLWRTSPGPGKLSLCSPPPPRRACIWK